MSNLSADFEWEYIKLISKAHSRDSRFFRFFDFDSREMLDEKIEVLKALIDGKAPCEIPNYYKVQELHPQNHPEKYPGGMICWDY